MLQEILFPIDFSERCLAVAPHVSAVAGRLGARVRLLHVFTKPWMWWEEGCVAAFDWDAEFKRLQEDYATRLESIAAQYFAVVRHDTHILDGSPAAEIARFAKAEHIDLIMMPTHGHGPFRRFLLGSVTASVLHDAACPVWTSAHSPDQVPFPQTYGRIVCALDLKAGSASLAQWAKRLAADFQATLIFVHAVPAASEHPVSRAQNAIRTYLFSEARDKWSELQGQTGLDEELCLVGGGDVAKALRDAALQHRADLLVAGRPEGLAGRVGSHTYKIIRRAPCPVVSV